MSQNNESLAVEAKIKQNQIDSNIDAIFDANVVAALALADEFGSIQPQEYVIPLEAIAGFSLEGANSGRNESDT